MLGQGRRLGVVKPGPASEPSALEEVRVALAMVGRIRVGRGDAEPLELRVVGQDPGQVDSRCSRSSSSWRTVSRVP